MGHNGIQPAPWEDSEGQIWEATLKVFIDRAPAGPEPTPQQCPENGGGFAVRVGGLRDQVRDVQGLGLANHGWVWPWLGELRVGVSLALGPVLLVPCPLCSGPFTARN